MEFIGDETNQLACTSEVSFKGLFLCGLNEKTLTL
jgi:hypothetical protein